MPKSAVVSGVLEKASSLRVRMEWVRGSLRTIGTFSRKKPLGAAGAVILLAMVFIAVFASMIAPFDPYAPHIVDTKHYKYAPPGTTIADTGGNVLDAGKTFLFGADQLGRDVFSRVLYGARISIFVSFVSVAIGVTLGALIGVISSYFGGKFDLVVQRFVDTMQAFPAIILALSIVAIAGPSIRNVVIALVAILVPGAARIIRSQALTIKETDYVVAARALGAGHGRIILHHMIPNCMPPYIVFATANLGFTIVIEAALSFLGVGTPPDVPSWGGMLGVAGQRYVAVSPWLVVFPSIAVSITVFGFNLFGDALRDVLDPRLRTGA